MTGGNRKRLSRIQVRFPRLRLDIGVQPVVEPLRTGGSDLQFLDGVAAQINGNQMVTLNGLHAIGARQPDRYADQRNDTKKESVRLILSHFSPCRELALGYPQKCYGRRRLDS
jgi:hypothetical protein